MTPPLSKEPETRGDLEQVDLEQDDRGELVAFGLEHNCASLAVPKN